MMGNDFPSIHAGSAMMVAIRIPGNLLTIVFIREPPLYRHDKVLGKQSFILTAE
jgi:hypothetical protein